MSEAEIEKIVQENKELRKQLATQQQAYNHLLEIVNNLSRHTYSKKAENGSTFYDQASLFDEAEYEQCQPEEPKEETVTVKEHSRKKVKKDFEDAEVKKVRIDHDLEDKKCPKCGTAMVELKPTIKLCLRRQPAQYILEMHYIHNYTCPKCSTDQEHPTMVSGESQPKLIEGSVVTPSLISDIIVKKFQQSVPLYRQEKEMIERKIPISRQNMSDWLLRIANGYLNPLYQIMDSQLRKEPILYGDETTVKCIEEKDRQKSYMWVRCTSPESNKQMILYSYNTNRGTEFAKELYKGFKGYLHVDGYYAYHSLPGVTVVGCFAHARRYVYDALCDDSLYSDFSKLRGQQRKQFLDQHQGYAGLVYLFDLIEELFNLEKKYKQDKLSTEEIYQKRNSEGQEILNKINDFIITNKDRYAYKSKSGKAITYLLENWKYLTNYLKDGRLDISNNRSEREAIKPFVIGRKNWLFANTRLGASASAILYSLVQSAKLNQLKPEAYLTYILEQMIGIDMSDNEKLETLLPYSKHLPINLKIRH